MKVSCTICGVPVRAEDAHRADELAVCRRCNVVFSFASGAGAEHVLLACDRCGGRIRASDVDLGARTATCRPCDHVRSFAGQIPRPRLQLPRGIVVEHVDPPARPDAAYREAPPQERRELVITQRPLASHAWGLAAFAAFWNLFIAAFCAFAGLGSEVALELQLVLGAFGVVGLGLAYGALTAFTNRTVIRVAELAVTVRCGPVPWWRERAAIATARLRRLHVRHRQEASGEGSLSTWDVLAETDDAEPVPLVARLHDPEQAAYIARAIEEHLGIGDPCSSDG